MCSSSIDKILGQCTIEHTITNIQCDDNNTPTFPFDDTFTFDITVTGTMTSLSWTADDLFLTSGNYGETISAGPYVITGLDLSFTITDDLNPSCSTTVLIETPCSDFCEIVVDIEDIYCNQNGTPENPDDDVFFADIDMSGFDVSAGWTADDPNNSAGSYGQISTFGPYTISDGALTFQVTDNDDILCMAVIELNPPATCAQMIEDTCTLAIVMSEPVCDNHGTVDGTDDTYTFGVVVSGGPDTSGWIADDPLLTAGQYNVEEIFGPFLISSGNTTLMISDIHNDTCSISLTVAAPAGCSDTICAITANIFAIECHHEGTPYDASDDTFTFSLEVNGSSASGAWQANDLSNTSGAFGDTVMMGPYLISDGIFNLEITNLANQNCITVVQITPPDACSDEQCPLSGIISNVICDDNGSPTDSLDDVFTFLLEMSGGSANGLWQADDSSMTSGMYDTAVIVGPYSVFDSFIQITIFDLSDSLCSWSANVPSPALQGCTSNCAVNYVLDGIVCDDNGTPTIPDDDIFNINLTVQSSFGSMTWVADDMHNSAGAYDSSATLGPYSIADGPVLFTIHDAQNVSCETMLFAIPPQTCSDSCVIDASVAVGNCLDNGTPFDSTDDVFMLDILVSGINSSEMWETVNLSSITGTYDSELTAGPYNISDGPFSFEIIDQEKTDCIFHIEIDPPFACSDSCQIQPEIVDIICNNQNTFTDSTDDVFYIDFSVQGLNTGMFWSIYEPVNFMGRFDSIYRFGPFPIDTPSFEFYLFSTENNHCAATLSIDPPSHCSNCFISLDLGPDREINCLASDILLMPILIENADDTILYTWEGPMTNWNINSEEQIIDSAGQYVLEVTHPLGCTDRDTIVINKIEPFQFISIDSFIQLMYGDSIYLEVEIDKMQSEIKEINWTPSLSLSCSDCLHPIANPAVSTEYHIQLVDTLGCILGGNIFIEVSEPPSSRVVFVPNIFTPNGDGLNDELNIYAGNEIKSIIRFNIYNRWGNIIFETRSENELPLTNFWNGLQNGEQAPSGVYTWAMAVTYIDGHEEHLTGNFTLLR